ncbi:hypothetical protein JVT61DRAFT_13907 [Boletus reticuloceps]|uniref:Uncharacterized protein n=1 Tax=Boletus reticuloceps TaxID=495285 RepID=A0A8I2YUD7_9AGAM|nr:hypothetical protein JVT61DRAFT_13907 [Boletus reticuloceps]
MGLTLYQRPSEHASDLPLDEAPPVEEPKQRDPHVIPTFTSESLTKPSSTVLYLPPLLSSLPRNLSIAPISADRPPLVTETRLPDIDPVSFSLHKALHNFHPLSEDYAGLPYALAFNWSELDLPEDDEREWYAVVFRSRRKQGSDSSPLYEADRKAHEEAVSNGGLIMYWYGIPNPDTGMNLATCIWQSRKHAIAANSRPHHIRAMKLAAVSYEIYALERYRLSKVKGEKRILVEDFSGVECGW